MSIDKFIHLLAFVPFLLLFLFKPKGKVKVGLYISFFILAFGPFLLPSVIFGKWNSIKELQNKNIRSIIVGPYWPASDINLSDSIVQINNADQVQHVIHLLKNTSIYRAGHSANIWQSSLIIVTNDLDSLKMHVSKTENQGTHIFMNNSTNSYNQEELGDYLEKILQYTPQKKKQ